jgi:hypothetical protein
MVTPSLAAADGMPAASFPILILLWWRRYGNGGGKIENNMRNW